jgi:hypothetical protein
VRQPPPASSSSSSYAPLRTTHSTQHTAHMQHKRCHCRQRQPAVRSTLHITSSKQQSKAAAPCAPPSSIMPHAARRRPRRPGPPCRLNKQHDERRVYQNASRALAGHGLALATR